MAFQVKQPAKIATVYGQDFMKGIGGTTLDPIVGDLFEALDDFVKHGRISLKLIVLHAEK
jgi:dipeptidyl aminopeptidase/acylaminoacyl peptidase